MADEREREQRKDDREEVYILREDAVKIATRLVRLEKKVNTLATILQRKGLIDTEEADRLRE